jgi:hypothetical protein
MNKEDKKEMKKYIHFLEKNIILIDSSKVEEFPPFLVSHP